MILKQLRLSHHLSQEQLAEMSDLNVRTIQRIESGHGVHRIRKVAISWYRPKATVLTN